MTPAADSILDDHAEIGGSRRNSVTSSLLRQVYAKARNENFPVALQLLAPRYRRHLLTLYTFARMVDDIGDTASGDRLAQLNVVASQVEQIFTGTMMPAAPVYRNLAHTVRVCQLSQEPFQRLIEANRRDQLVQRYRTFTELLEYCALSAQPIGRLVLEIFGWDTERYGVASDRICSALQILEHCQDVVEDARSGRIYLPEQDLNRFQVVERDLLTSQASRSVRALVGFQVQRAVNLLDEGKFLVGELSGAARLAVAGYVAGGYATADALVTSGFDVVTATPRPNRRSIATGLVHLLISGGKR